MVVAEVLEASVLERVCQLQQEPNTRSLLVAAAPVVMDQLLQMATLLHSARSLLLEVAVGALALPQEQAEDLAVVVDVCHNSLAGLEIHLQQHHLKAVMAVPVELVRLSGVAAVVAHLLPALQQPLSQTMAAMEGLVLHLLFLAVALPTQAAAAVLSTLQGQPGPEEQAVVETGELLPVGRLAQPILEAVAVVALVPWVAQAAPVS